MMYDILQDFPGSQDGRFTEKFKAGTTVELSAYLAGHVVPCGWARLHVENPAAVENKAIVEDGRQTGTLKLRRK